MELSTQDFSQERAARALEGIELLLAMWMEKSVPAGEIWLGEGPDRDVSRRPWRLGEPERGADLERRIERMEETLQRLTRGVNELETRIHEETE